MIIYCDDTVFYENGSYGPEKVGIGCLLLKEDNSNQIIQEGLDNLRNDTEINKQDRRTLAKNYFHASDDSDNAHSHLCNAINKHLSGEFHYVYDQRSGKKISKLINKCLSYLAIMAASVSTPIQIYIERSSFISEEKIIAIIKETFTHIEMGAYQYYAIPYYFPKISIEIVDKKNHGVQITDFLLWANNRARFVIPKNKWLSRIKSILKTEATLERSKWLQADMVFKKPIQRYGNKNCYPKKIFPITAFQGKQHIEELFQIILTKVTSILNSKTLPSKITHLINIKNSLWKSLYRANFMLHNDLTREILSFYLKIFDTLPIYSSYDKESTLIMQKLIQTKRLAGLALNKKLINSNTTISYLSKRYKEYFKLVNTHLPLFEKN